MLSRYKFLFLLLLLAILVYICLYAKIFKLNYFMTKTTKANDKVIVKNAYDQNLILEPSKSTCAQFSQNEKLFLFIFVIMSPDSHSLRRTIRDKFYANSYHYYEKYKVRFKLMFTVGLSKLNQSSNEILKRENYFYNDILQADLYDSYHVLTIKNMLAFKWINAHCSHTHFILRTCDDVLFNLDGLIFYLINKLNYRYSIFV
jgi:hypothetical protein